MISGTRELKPFHKLVLYAILGVLLFTAIFPFYWIVLTSLKTGRAVYDTQQLLVPQSPTLENYTRLFLETDIAKWIVTSTSLALASTVIALLIGILAAFSLTRFRYRGRKVLGLAVFMAYIIPEAILFIPLFLLLNQLHLSNTFLGLVLANQTFSVPFCTWLLLGYFQTLPRELEDAALIDGCSPLGTLVKIILPLIAPGIATAAIFSFTTCWNEFLYAATLIQSAGLKTLPLGIAGFLVSDVFQWGNLMAASVIAVVPMLALFIFLQRYIIQGLTLGGVKG